MSEKKPVVSILMGSKSDFTYNGGMLCTVKGIRYSI